ncbi:beta-phosphoglucomutase [Romboutsia weinsteinii]|uniref:Beta-phosphoglucomutase n=1 Tax=Romboutsia weinsteinii TaxID=2020949 RepID=A0A371J728_9FIRM|nr:beta-phosphoglucomutase [Romboutsia weinsteinii]RDY28535.1 beta-phosphoglucomutase [Romboutsia weinsteinii]
MKFKGVIFDLDGVVTDTAEYHFIAWKDLADRIGIDIDIEFNETLKGISRGESLERILVKGNKQNDYTQEEKDKLLKIKNDYYLTLLEKLTPKDVMDNIHDTLEYLKENNFKVALASASKNAPLIINKLELNEFFDIIVDPTSVKAGKPSPDIFIEGARLIGLEVNECLGVEDSEAGVTSINDANMYSIGIGSELNLKHANIVIPSTSALKNTIISVVESSLIEA